MRNLFLGTSFSAALFVGTLNLAALPAKSAGFVQTNLVSDIANLAKITDPELANPWGVSHSPTTPFWVSNQGRTPPLSTTSPTRQMSRK